MLMVKPAWSLASCLVTSSVPTSSRHWWAPWGQPRRGRWSTSRASCFYRASMITSISSCSKNEATFWTRWASSSCGSYWVLPKTELLQCTGLSPSFCFQFIFLQQIMSNSTLTDPAGVFAYDLIWFHCAKQNHKNVFENILGFQGLNNNHIHSFRW